MRARTAAATVAALLLPLTAACGDSGSDDPAPATTAASSPAADTDETEPDDGQENDGQDNGTELKVGQSYTFENGPTVTVDSIKTVTEFSEFDLRPKSGEQAFRVNVTFDNTKGTKPINLDEFSLMVVGATNGGDAKGTYFEAGKKEITGRIAPGQKDTKNHDYTLEKQYGKDVVVTVTWAGDEDFMDEPPTWAGTIQ